MFFLFQTLLCEFKLLLWEKLFTPWNWLTVKHGWYTQSKYYYMSKQMMYKIWILMIYFKATYNLSSSALGQGVGLIWSIHSFLPSKKTGFFPSILLCWASVVLNKVTVPQMLKKQLIKSILFPKYQQFLLSCGTVSVLKLQTRRNKQGEKHFFL